MRSNWIRIDKKTGQKEKVSEEWVLEMARSHYKDPALAISHAKEGYDIQSSFYIYQYRTEGET